jgi:hypothetical protein
MRLKSENNSPPIVVLAPMSTPAAPAVEIPAQLARTAEVMRNLRVAR